MEIEFLPLLDYEGRTLVELRRIQKLDTLVSLFSMDKQSSNGISLQSRGIREAQTSTEIVVQALIAY